MSITLCPTCHHEHSWCWEDAFDKFGFDDGDGFILTEHVAEALRVHGYAVKVEPWGCHNITIASIRRGQTELIPVTANLGYDDPRSYLPKTIVALLVAAFPPDGEVEL
jgi:hypothetical protein